MGLLDFVKQHRALSELLHKDLENAVKTGATQAEIDRIVMAISVIDNSLISLYEELEGAKTA